MNRFDWLEFDTPAEPNYADGALRAAPQDGPSCYQAGRRMRESGFFESAAKYFKKAVGFNEHHHAAWIALVDTLIRAGEIEEADQISHDALNNYRKVRLFYASRALALAHRGSLREAFPLSGVSLEGEATWYSRAVRAELLLKESLQNRAAALALLEEALDLAEGRWESCFVGGLILFDAGWPALAAGFFSEAGRHNPRAAAGWLYLGDCFHALRLYEQARFYYQKVQELEPQHELTLRRMKASAGHVFGLTRVFQPNSLQRRWNREFEKLVNKQEPEINDF